MKNASPVFGSRLWIGSMVPPDGHSRDVGFEGIDTRPRFARFARFLDADVVVVPLAAGFGVARHLVAWAALRRFAVEPRRVVL